MEFEYGRIEPTDSEKDYTIFEIGHFAYKLKLRKFNLLYRNHHRKGTFDVLEIGYGILQTKRMDVFIIQELLKKTNSKFVIHANHMLLKIFDRSNVQNV